MRPSPGLRVPPLASLALAAAALLAAACSGNGGEGGTPALTGDVTIDGSSTVFPITEAVAEEFMAEHPDVRVTVGVSGTGGGFERLCRGETQISNASRPIRDAERQLCAQHGITDVVELFVAFDGLSVLVNPQNTFVDCLTTAELKRIWEPGSTVRTWRDVRADWPADPIRLYGPGTDSGTFDYFTEVVVGQADASRADYTASEDDNVLVQGIAGDRNALGYFGYAYYVENRDRLKLVAVDGGGGCVRPSPQTIEDGTYTPLSRPLFIYTSADLLRERPELAAFVRYYLTEGRSLAAEVGYVPGNEARYREGLDRLEAALR
ncbi:MAG TPA: PstS family phosphate ABC transporter substrate-binding protein [Dehalococcoidia bacterium]